jgi:hypothetical protein
MTATTPLEEQIFWCNSSSITLYRLFLFDPATRYLIKFRLLRMETKNSPCSLVSREPGMAVVLVLVHSQRPLTRESGNWDVCSC